MKPSSGTACTAASFGQSAVLIGAFLVFATAGLVARTGADVAGKAAASVASTGEPMDLVLDTMLRPTSARCSPGCRSPGRGTAGANSGHVLPRRRARRGRPHPGTIGRERFDRH